ncbi:MAG: HlyC/CorC family transporter [Clostridia bacterium]|nr:HlyC/CorC family transporter [Clostridia bacterium]
MDDPGSFPIGSIILYLVFVLGCAYFAGTETSLASINRIHMMSEADKGNKKAERVLYILDDFESALSVLLIGNNVMNIGCATLAVVIARRAIGTGSLAVTLATIITTVIIYIFGEILPKVYARSCNESFAMNASGLLVALMKILKPFSVSLSFISGLALRPFRKKIDNDVTVTEDELASMVENISEDDEIDEETGKLMRSVLEFSDRTAGEIAIPFDDVLKIKAGTKTADILEIIKNTTHSRIPVLARDNSVKGILQIRKFLRAYIKNKGRVILASVLDYPYFVKSNTTIDDLLTEMSNHRRNLAIVKDPDGNTIGIVTIEDILEELVGEIYDEEDIGGDSDE